MVEYPFILLIYSGFMSRPLRLPAYFQYHAYVRLRFKLSCGLGQSLTRDGSLPQGCPREHDLYCLSVHAFELWSRTSMLLGLLEEALSCAAAATLDRAAREKFGHG